jgi:O-antigen/teichoic acid export membrane protein
MGTYRQVLYLGPFAAVTIEFGLSSTVYRFWNIFEGERRKKYVRLLILLTVSLGAIGSIILAALSQPLSIIYDNPALRASLLVTCAYPLATIPLGILRPVLLSSGYSLRATLLETGFSAISLISMVLPLLMGASLTEALSIWTAVSLLRLVTLPMILGQYLKGPGSWFDREILAELWSYLWPIQLGRVPAYLTSYLDKIVASVYLTPENFAYYSLGAREIPFVGMIGTSVAGVLIPHMVQDAQTENIERVCQRWRSCAERTALLTYLIASFCVWHAVAVMQFFFSSAYIQSSVPFRVFAAMTFVRVIEYGSLAKAFGWSDTIMQSALVGAGVLGISMLILTWQLGVLGLALSFLVSSVACAWYYLFVYVRRLKRPVSSFFPILRLSFIFIVSVASTIIAGTVMAPFVKIEPDMGIARVGVSLLYLFMGAGFCYVTILGLSVLIRRRFMRVKQRLGATLQ